MKRRKEEELCVTREGEKRTKIGRTLNRDGYVKRLLWRMRAWWCESRSRTLGYSEYRGSEKEGRKGKGNVETGVRKVLSRIR